jgi:Tol biopolymer transport system component
MIGTRLGPYEITAKLGEGGMGEVYRATDTKLKRDVAIKVLPAEFTLNKERLARFEREAQLLAQLNHPGIAAIHGLEESDGVRALVMELVEGPTLAERLEQGPLPFNESLSVSLQIARALEEAHEKGIVHRDLKPQNIKASIEGKVKVLDFGLAKAMDPAAGSTASAADLARSPTLMQSPTLTAAHGTQLGVILGTAAYMAPEQARGVAVDRRADIWAFGVVLYEMLTGRRLFEGELVTDVLANVLKTEVDLAALPPEAPASIRRLLRRCLERNPKNRLRDIGDARLVLEEVLAGRAEEPAAGEATGASRANGGRPAFFAAGVVALLLVAASFWLGRRVASGDGGVTTATAPTAVRFQQLTDAPGVETTPSLSPDGKDVVFVRVADGRSEILIQRVGARVSTSLTASSGVEDRQPAFSPDGERIAFRSERDGGGIFLMDTAGESVRRLTDFGFHPTWSPDGKEIAVAVGDFIFPTDRGGAVRGLRAVDVATGAVREVSREGDVMQPRWSPHGRRIAFWGLRLQTGQRDLYTVAADGSEAESPGVEVTNDAALDWSPEWSPDGRFLYFSSNRGGTMNLWRVAIDEASGRTLGAPEPVTTPSLWTGGLSFSRDGGRLAYGSLDWRTTLYRAELDAANGRLAGAPTPVLKGTQPIRDHQLSPDGEWLVHMRVTAQEDLFVSRVDGSQSRRLTDDAFRDRGPAWSPNGERIAFYSDRSGTYQVWLIRADGSGLERATALTEGTANFPVWSPDGRRLALSIIPGGGHLLDLSSGALPVTPAPLPPVADGLQFWPLSWSPDGRRLAGIAVRDSGIIERVATHDLAAGTYELFDHDSGRQWRIPVWLADSRRLVARDGRGIWLLDPGRSAPRRLVEVGGYATGVSVGLSRDDRWLTWSETGTEGDVWIAELAGELETDAPRGR